MHTHTFFFLNVDRPTFSFTFLPVYFQMFFFFLLIAVPFASFFLSPVVATAIVFTLLLAVRVERERWKRKRKRRKRTFLIVCGPVEGGADKHHSVCRAVNVRKGEKGVFFFFCASACHVCAGLLFEVLRWLCKMSLECEINEKASVSSFKVERDI